MATFYGMQKRLADASTDIFAEANRLAEGIGKIMLANANAKGLAAKHAQLKADIDAYLGQKPDSAVAQVMKASFAELEAEFAAFVVDSQKAVDAINGLNK